MSKSEQQTSFGDVESRRSKASRRRMTPGRRLMYAIGMPLLRGILFLLNASYRVVRLQGEDVVDRMIADEGQAYMPCYWHQHHIVCSNLVRTWLKRGFRACYIVSASVDGEVPARIARAWGAEVIRGSAADTGALVLRDINEMMKRGVSIVTTSDGPLGPACEFKAGTVLASRIGNAPMVPVAYAADRAWQLDTWDRFIIPKPFARIAIAVGQPVSVPRDTSPEQMETIRQQMQASLNALIQDSRDALVDAT